MKYSPGPEGHTERWTGPSDCHYAVEEHQPQMRRVVATGSVHEYSEICDEQAANSNPCVPVEEGVVPEFTIEIRYQTGDQGLVYPNNQSGWKYTITWTDKRGHDNCERGWGHSTRDIAKEEAEGRCAELAKAMTLAEKYTYTPEI
jgi:hypothetical protein